jgi:hypothetical protein
MTIGTAEAIAIITNVIAKNFAINLSARSTPRALNNLLKTLPLGGAAVHRCDPRRHTRPL